jgi:hypothetical protein
VIFRIQLGNNLSVFFSVLPHELLNRVLLSLTLGARIYKLREERNFGPYWSNIIPVIYLDFSPKFIIFVQDRLSHGSRDPTKTIGVVEQLASETFLFIV